MRSLHEFMDIEPQSGVSGMHFREKVLGKFNMLQRRRLFKSKYNIANQYQLHPFFKCWFDCVSQQKKKNI